ncbi:hypothetical protein G7Z17_g10571 [Cylindrodendrum hubeiense]|uniref:Uncharacterized protein n=1 Tax=Cylindrodendrum hubeiense TaxID=595255 RepID=A0A9P5H5P5_9HYPO|nr:hypothetical protein G7Z17_g10571 [Cylindrodendrum hubeiense]
MCHGYGARQIRTRAALDLRCVGRRRERAETTAAGTELVRLWAVASRETPGSHFLGVAKNTPAVSRVSLANEPVHRSLQRTLPTAVTTCNSRLAPGNVAGWKRFRGVNSARRTSAPCAQAERIPAVILDSALSTNSAPPRSALGIVLSGTMTNLGSAVASIASAQLLGKTATKSCARLRRAVPDIVAASRSAQGAGISSEARITNGARIVDDYRRLCERHCCNAPHCETETAPGDLFCKDHQCQDANCLLLAKVFGGYCAPHACVAQGCGGLRVDLRRNLCVQHVYRAGSDDAFERARERALLDAQQESEEQHELEQQRRENERIERDARQQHQQRAVPRHRARYNRREQEAEQRAHRYQSLPAQQERAHDWWAYP